MGNELVLGCIILLIVLAIFLLYVRTEVLQKNLDRQSDTGRYLEKQVDTQLNILTGLVQDKKALDNIIWDVLDYFQILENDLEEISNLTNTLNLNLQEELNATDEDYAPIDEVSEAITLKVEGTYDDTIRCCQETEAKLYKYGLGEYIPDAEVSEDIFENA